MSLESINCKNCKYHYGCKDSDNCYRCIGLIGKRNLNNIIVAYNCIIDFGVQLDNIKFDLILKKINPIDFNRFIEYEISDDPIRDEFIKFLKDINVKYLFRDRIGIEWYFRENYPMSIKYIIRHSIRCESCEELYYCLNCIGCSYSVFLKKCVNCYNCEHCVNCTDCEDCSGLSNVTGLKHVHMPIDLHLCP